MPLPLQIASLLLWLVTAIALAAAIWTSHKRASRAREELARELHDRSLHLDRRCDHLQEQIDRLTTSRRIDHLFSLITAGEAEGRLETEVAGRLRRYALTLEDESRAIEGPSAG